MEDGGIIPGRIENLVQGHDKLMLKVYNYMALGLTVTGLVSYHVSTTKLMPLFAHNIGLVLLAFLLEIGIAQYLVSRGVAQQLKFETALGLFMTYCVLNGATLSPIFAVYTSASIYSAFFTTAAVFVTMSVYGYVTKKDLTTAGSYAIMVLWGVIVAMFINMLVLQSGQMSFFISCACVVLFTGLTAYDTQKIRQMLIHSPLVSEDGETGLAIVGALILYLDFVNLFLHLLRILGDRRD